MRRARGVTLIELLLVIGLIAAATALAASVVTAGLPGQQLRGAAREVAAQLRYTRAQAIVTGKAQMFTIDAQTREWQAPNRRHGVLPKVVKIVATVARSEQPKQGVAGVRFFPEGASTGGRIMLQHERAGWQLDVDWLTGEVTLARAEASP